MDAAAWDLLKNDEHVCALIGKYCANECDHAWACDGCVLAEAKERLAWSHLETRLPGLRDGRTPRQRRAAFDLVKGGRP